MQRLRRRRSLLLLCIPTDRCGRGRGVHGSRRRSELTRRVRSHSLRALPAACKIAATARSASSISLCTAPLAPPDPVEPPPDDALGLVADAGVSAEWIVARRLCLASSLAFSKPAVICCSDAAPLAPCFCCHSRTAARTDSLSASDCNPSVSAVCRRWAGSQNALISFAIRSMVDASDDASDWCFSSNNRLRCTQTHQSREGDERKNKEKCKWWWWWWW